MPASCCVVGCTTRRDQKSRALGIGLFRIPANKRRRAAWIAAISRKNWSPHTWDVVCGLHFVSGQPVDCSEDVDYCPTQCMTGKDKVGQPETLRDRRARKRTADAQIREIANVSI
jgi:hypothetical protein